jgi:hypothetical protein
MRVKLKKRKQIMQQIREAQVNAAVQDRDIYYIELTRDELYQFLDEANYTPFLEPFRSHIMRKLEAEDTVSFYLLGTEIIYNTEGRTDG